MPIPTGAVFAPMAGLTDAACRHLMADHGAAWTVSEMASAKALNFNDDKILGPAAGQATPRPVRHPAVWLRSRKSMAKAILLVQRKGHPV